MKTYLAPIDPKSLIGKEYPTVDYQDAFGIKIPIEYAVAPEELVKIFFQSFPKWAYILLGIRETFAGWIGLKTAKGIDLTKQMEAFAGQPGQSIGLFHVKDRSEVEILTGETDKHLDFSLSFIGNKMESDFEIILATTVIFNGWLGKAYFTPVKPVHRLLVPAMLKRMALQLMKKYT